MRVPETVSKLGVNILWLVSCFSMSSEKLIDEMVVYVAVRKLLGLLHVDGGSSMKEALKMMRMHGARVLETVPLFSFSVNG